MKKFFNWLGKFIVWYMTMVAFNETLRAWDTPHWLVAVFYIIGLAAWWMWYFTED